MKKIKLMMLIMGLSGLLQAGECKIDYMGTLDKENILSYEVNNKLIVVTLDKGILFRIMGYVSKDKNNTFKKAYIISSKICFDSDMKECTEVDSSNNDEIINIFLEKMFCNEE